MTRVMLSVPAPGRRRKRSRWNILSAVALQIAAMVAIGLLLYADAANWFSVRNHGAEISGYAQRVEQTPSSQRESILAAAYRYNEELEPGPLTDPYITLSQDEMERSPKYLAYEDLLRLTGTDAIGTINYPALDIALPIFHGTADRTISRGVGHLYGTSLPVGGPSTRAVLTAHSGLPHAKLFTNLPKAQVGDRFWISVLGEDHHYEVRSVETVLPGETGSLQIVEGQDWVTLFTCTPIGVNSHRFMVHAERIATPSGPDDSIALVAGGASSGFPWWAIWFVLGSAAVALILFAPPRRTGR